VKQRAFEAAHEARWSEFERLIEELDRRGRASPPRALQDRLAEFPGLYRRICHDLAVASERRYSPRLVDRLNRLALAGHRILYVHDLALASRVTRFLARDFARAVRRDRRPILVALALFVGPALVFFVAVGLAPELVYSLMTPDRVREFEAMYDPAATRIGSNRESAEDLMMFGFYVYNNVGIAFRAFAGGLVLGLGSVVVLVLNGVLLGGVAAHIGHLGFEQTFFSFVIGHGAFELTAIVISGAAGLELGWALVAPGPRSRLEALRRAGARAIELVWGVFAMLLAAALIEAFWSSKTNVDASLKFVVGALLWLGVLAWLGLAGRRGAGTSS